MADDMGFCLKHFKQGCCQNLHAHPVGCAGGQCRSIVKSADNSPAGTDKQNPRRYSLAGGLKTDAVFKRLSPFFVMHFGGVKAVHVFFLFIRIA